MGEGRGLISMNKTRYSSSACLWGLGLWGGGGGGRWRGGEVELGISG